MMILGLPLHFYSSFVHEHKWQFSNQTVKTWFWELFKSFLVGLVLLYIVVGLLLWVMHRSPHLWWLVAGLVMAVVSVIFATLFPVVVLPIFNKYTPIEDDELTSALREILSRGGLKSSGFFKEDMSRQTKKENAFLAGLGKTRRVVLADNLLDNMTVPEIESIIAHEVGHYRHLHIWKSILVDTFQQVIVFFLLHQVMRSLFPAFLSSPRADLNLLPVMAILIGFLSGFLFGPIGRAISRRFEREADAYSLEAILDKQAFLTALAGLADRNLSNAYPEWWVKLLYYSHPPIGERLEMAEKSGSG
jgi:STE24 endopeptidase